MKSLTLLPVQAIIGLGGGEIILILASLLVAVLMIGGIIALVLWLARRSHPPTATPPVQPNAPTRRFCDQCGNEMAADAPQGLCPACLMKVALGTEGGHPAGAGERKPAPPPADIAAHFPQLEILELLGQGGMGMVYKARQRQLDRFVALKLLPSDSGRDPAFAERFTREAKALARLNHPNIVSVYDFGQAGEFYYFMMEYVDGVNLRQMEHARRLTPREALTIVPRICDALQYAHDEGIVHRDVKPENILIDKKGRVKIADFGLAKLLGHAPKDFRLTGPAHVMGTPHYMAPEQLERPLDVDHRADIYSLGVVFYEMLTGELPLGRFAPPSAKAQLDVRLDEVVLRLLEKEPQRRYQHISEVKTEVETIVGGAGVGHGSADQPPKPREDRFWKRFALGIALVVLAMILIPVGAILLAMIIPAFSKAWSRQHEVQSAVVQQSQSVPKEIITDYTTTTNRLAYLASRDRRLLAEGLREEHPWVKPARMEIAALSRHKADLESRYKLAPTGSSTNSVLASAESWSPSVAPGEKPDPAKVLEEAHALATQKSRYDDALQRFIWYHDHAQEFSTNNPSGWLISALSDWIELGRRYPKARSALIEIRDRKNREFAEGRGYFELFQETANINQYMSDDVATVALFHRIEQSDATLAGQCYLIAESLLVKRGEYGMCLRHIRDYQARFDGFRREWDFQKKMEQNMADAYQRISRTNLPPIPSYALDMRKRAEDRFVDQTRTLIEILVGGGRKADAEKIRDQAVAVLEDARLKSAVSDAEEKVTANVPVTR